MSADNDRKAGLVRLQQVLDAYGGDQRRWPRADAVALAPLLVDAAARATLAEAKALDLALAAAPEASPGRSRALADRILGEIGAPHDRDAVVDLAKRRAAATRTTLSRRAVWQTATALAACLVLGVVVGASDLLGSSLDDVAALAGFASDGDTLTTALGQALQLSYDEETL